MPGKSRFHAAVIVGGDIARSPRMMYHAEALAGEIADVQLIGRAGERLPRAIEENPHIRCRFLPGARWRGRGALRLPVSTLRAVVEFFGVLRVLLAAPGGWDLMLLQTPPAFPAYWALRIARRLRGGSLVVDWHNFGAPLLALRGGLSAAIVPALRRLETGLARSRSGHLCVSRAMSEALLARGARGTPIVFYDRPDRRFLPVGVSERFRLREKLSSVVAGLPLQAPILVSPTSWTPDEDHDLLLEALAELDGIAGPGELLVAVIITGRGDGRAAFEEAARRRRPSRAAVATMWLEADEYSRLLGAADAGLCLHRSASGVDLPIKIADLRGAGLPVLALRSSDALSEVFAPERDGALFESARELAGQLRALTDPSSDLAARFALIRESSLRQPLETWQEGWKREARPLLEAAGGKRAAGR